MLKRNREIPSGYALRRLGRNQFHSLCALPNYTKVAKPGIWLTYFYPKIPMILSNAREKYLKPQYVLPYLLLPIRQTFLRFLLLEFYYHQNANNINLYNRFAVFLMTSPLLL